MATYYGPTDYWRMSPYIAEDDYWREEEDTFDWEVDCARDRELEEAREHDFDK